MPGFNKKGPQGKGPGTGKRKGKCYNKNVENFEPSETSEKGQQKRAGIRKRLRDGSGNGQQKNRKGKKGNNHHM